MTKKKKEQVKKDQDTKDQDVITQDLSEFITQLSNWFEIGYSQAKKDLSARKVNHDVLKSKIADKLDDAFSKEEKSLDKITHTLDGLAKQLAGHFTAGYNRAKQDLIKSNVNQESVEKMIEKKIREDIAKEGDLVSGDGLTS